MTTLTSPHPGVTHYSPRFVRVPPALRRDHARQAAATAYQLARDLSDMIDEQIGALFFCDRTTFQRHRTGKMPSAKSRSREEILRLGEAGGNPWPIVVDDVAAAVQTSVAPMDTGALKAARSEIYRMEQDANHAFDRVQFDREGNRPVADDVARDSMLRQVAFTLIALAIDDELSVRRD